MWKIGDIFRDIVDDYNIIESRTAKTDYRGRNRGGAAFWIMLIPQIIGFVGGLAVARLFHLDGSAYIPIGAIFALAFGTYKSVSYDKISLVPAIIRNLIIMLIFCALLLIAFVRNK